MKGQEIKEQEEAARRWVECLDEVHARIGPRFARTEQRQRARAYLQGLLSPIERKNGWQLAEAAGEANPYGYQELLSRAPWDADEVRDDLLDLVREKLADPAAVVVIDETGFLKKGMKSVGVAPQYSGTAGKISNCQIGVFAAYATAQGQVLMDRELYLPRQWTDNRSRCKEAGVPQSVAFATKLVLARRMLERVLAHGLPFAWVTADSVYGADYHLRRFLTEHHLPYVLAVAPNHLVRLGWEEGYESIRLDDWLARLGRVRWYRLSAGWGSKGPRWFDWAWWKMNAEVPAGWQAWVLVRRSISDPEDLLFHLVCAPSQTTLHQIVQVAGQRWQVEEAIERAKEECGLDQYEVRSWTGWYRHVTLSLLAQFCATLMTQQANSEQGKKAQKPPPLTGGPNSLASFKCRRGLAAS
jgi:SRSO17 transposase